MVENATHSDQPDYIEGAAPEAIAGTADPSVADLHSQRLLDAESAWFRKRRTRSGLPDDGLPSTGLAFSGGGVRSAAFALGVLQVLAGRRLLERFDYLSSVSGGGFMAGALIWLLGPRTRTDFGTGPDNFPFVAEPRPDSSSATDERSAFMLNFLRLHGAYLTPGHGITLTSTIAVVLRGILLNLLVWIPILVALMSCLLIVSGLVNESVIKGTGIPVAFEAMSWIAIGFGVLFLIGSLVYSFSTDPHWSTRRTRYLLHRRYETRTPWLLWPLLGAATLASLPWAANASFGWIGQFGGAAFVVIGLIVGLWSFLRPDSSWGVSFVRKRALPLGALAALYGVLLFAYQSAQWLYVDASTAAKAAAAVLLALALLSGRFVNLNYISVQRYYRDRLMEVFMPDPDSASGPIGGPAPVADGQSLSSCLDSDSGCAPYPLFNTHLPLASARSRRRRLRGGDNFILSPLYCGSTATGWRRTSHFMEDGMTLPTAMAISGSVNHQQTGLGEVGLALNPLVSVLKALLNLRMSYWVPNPRTDDQSLRPNHFVPGLDAALGVGRDETCTFVQLEDGGYFDNLGLYELIRRRLGVILVCDAGADARLSDLYRVLRFAEVDFGARITFDNEDDYHAIIPSEAAAPSQVGKRAQRAHLIARIDYADASTGTLIYLKSALVPGMRFNELGFGSLREGFPHENTMDQFFDEEQFDAHRRLGCELARRLIDETDIEHLLAVDNGE